ncbi:invasin domain 3-containing protein [Tumidithrix elongata RA019]|uniref:Invasin domain 3-containing protein n=1 Tax=Tumidithrix elongata BACA0141 TaxID=2716417 RepID=A0AAW9Q1U8_9CYAN|nr:invasin domain 3-containing protein [Tumidithrix elongata RA019]
MKTPNVSLTTLLVLATIPNLGLLPLSTLANEAQTEQRQLEQDRLDPQKNSPQITAPQRIVPVAETQVLPAQPTSKQDETKVPVQLEQKATIQTPVSPSSQETVKPSTQVDVVKPAIPSVSAPSQTLSQTALPPLQILAPISGTVLDTPSSSIMVQFPIGKTVELRVNGIAVNPKQIGRTETNTSTNLTTQVWYGVVLKEGENLLEVQDNQGNITQAKIQVRGEIAQLSLRTQETRVPADGRSTATVIGQLVDAQGNRASRNAIVTLTATDGEFVGIDQDPAQPGFQVKAENGQFTSQLRSSLNSGNVTIRAISGSKLEAFTQVQFESNLRPSIVTGVIDLRFGARGTDYYRSFRDFLPTDQDNRNQVDFYAALFGTGRIGEWQITGAYNSARPLNLDCNGKTRLFRDVQFCDQSYPTYGDSSVTTVVTPSLGSLFLRLERTSPVPLAGTDYIMWGDFKTEEFTTSAQQFTAITRQLNGLKLNYNLGDLQITGFYSNTDKAFQRDSIAPDGTSGYYFVSRRLVLAGSETVYVELEEQNRPGEVIKRDKLERGQDYEIDYDRGTLLFRKPLLQTAFGDTGILMTRKIVVTYEYEATGTSNNLYAGQLRYHFSRELNRESWLGANYFKEDQGSRIFQLYGASAAVSFGTNGKLVAEYARSDNFSDILGRVTGAAARVEVNSEIISGITGRAYYRTADTGFANNATISFVPGQTRFGAQVIAKLSPTTNLTAAYDQEENRGLPPQPLTSLADLLALRQNVLPVGTPVDNSLRTFSIGLQQKLGDIGLELTWLSRDREDRVAPNQLSGSSSQLRSQINVPITNNLRFLALNETSLSSTVDPVYQDRSAVGLDWAIIDGITLRVAQQWFHNGRLAGSSVTSADLLGEYKLGSDTTLTGRYTVLGGANTGTTQGALGINQRWTIAPGLGLNFAYERIFGDFSTQTATGTQFLQPFSPGQNSSTLATQAGDNFSIGFEYTDNPDFKASAKYEYRTSSTGSNTVISAAALGKLSPSLTALVRYQQAGVANQLLSGLGDTSNLKIGLAYRDPANDNFNALLKYEFRQNPGTIPDTLLSGSGSGSQTNILSAEAIYSPNWQWEFYGKFALRDSTSYLAKDLVGTSSITLSQLRATYRLGYNWDLVAEGRLISQPSAGYTETGFLAELGYHLTPNLRVGVGYSSGGVNVDRDFSGSRSAGGLYAAVTFKINELFDGFGLQKVAPPQPQESTTKVTEVPKVPEPNVASVPVEANPIASSSVPANLSTPLPAVTNPSRPPSQLQNNIARLAIGGVKQQMTIAANGAIATYSVATKISR